MNEISFTYFLGIGVAFEMKDKLNRIEVGLGHRRLRKVLIEASAEIHLLTRYSF